MKKIVVIISLILLLNAFVFLLVLGSKSESGTNYAIVLPYQTDSSDNFGYVWNGEKFVEKVSGNGVVTQVVYTPQGVTNGGMASKYFVNVLIDGEVQNMCLAEYVHTHINTISLSDDFVTYSFSEDGKIVNTNIENIEVAETVMYNEFLYRFSTYHINSVGEYIFEASDLPVNDMTVLDDTENNQGFFSLGMIAFESASPEDKFNNVIDVYSAGHDLMSPHVIEHLTVHEDTIFIVKTVEENNECYYTWKGGISDANRPLFDRYTVFTNAMSIIENNSESLVSDGDTSERLVVFYGECLSYFNPPEE